MSPGHADRVVAGAARTHVGGVRSKNEDACLVRPRAGLFMVADGMGGHAAGEVASALAVETVDERLAGARHGPGREPADGGSPGDGGAGGASRESGGALVAERGRVSGTARLPDRDDASREPAGAERAVREAVTAANRRIHRQARDNPEQGGMGTTATVLCLPDRGRWLAGQVGDSRAYLLRDGELSRITTDHTLVPGSSTLTRALGTRDDVEVDVLGGELLPGDRFLLCSDGLTDMMSHDDVRDLLVASVGARDRGAAGVGPGNEEGGADGGRPDGDAGRGAGGSLEAVERAADALVDEVLDRGAHDNVTVVVVGA